jgi:hypothetical protein
MVVPAGPSSVGVLRNVKWPVAPVDPVAMLWQTVHAAFLCSEGLLCLLDVGPLYCVGLLAGL